MPWNPKEPWSKSGHNRKATGAVGRKATRIANAVMRSGASDVTAIRVANKYVKTHQGRGAINRSKGR